MEANDQSALLTGVVVGIAAGIAIGKIVQHQREMNSRISAEFVESLREIDASPIVMRAAERDLASA